MKLNSELGEFHSFWYPCLKTAIIFVRNYGFIRIFFLSFLILHRKQTRLQGFPVSLLNTFKSSCLSIFPNTWSGPSSLIHEFCSSSSLRFILLLPELAPNVCSSCPSVINVLPAFACGQGLMATKTFFIVFLCHITLEMP